MNRTLSVTEPCGCGNPVVYKTMDCWQENNCNRTGNNGYGNNGMERNNGMVRNINVEIPGMYTRCTETIKDNKRITTCYAGDTKIVTYKPV